MGYANLQTCIRDLETTGQLIRLDVEVDPHLEAGAIQRRVYRAKGPALLFTRVKGCRFPMLGNLFGTLERTRFLFRDTLSTLQRLARLRVDPSQGLRAPWKHLGLIRAMWHVRPRFVTNGPILAASCTLDDLPRQVSWPRDGGAFITLPQVYSENPARPGWRYSNLGMYRVQLSGGKYRPNREAGLHYQIHRGIGAHHAHALERGQPLRVNVFVGGPPAMILAAVMPLPEGMPELGFAGMLGGKRLDMVLAANGLPMPAQADFCLSGVVENASTLPEGPFGDHLGYYSLEHDFPVLRIERVHHRIGAIWPFTTVGRPPQEDTSFGALIHELTGEAIPAVLPGVRGVHAVDAAGVHPLLLALGSERYVPYEPDRAPRELLTQANAILGQGQLSLAKYLFIANHADDPRLDIHDVPAFFRHVLCRADWTRDLHFQTCTTMDTLDYSGLGLNEGSKVVIAAAGASKRTLPASLQGDPRLPDGFANARMCLPGILAVQGPPCLRERRSQDPLMKRFCLTLEAIFSDGQATGLRDWPLLVVVDDSAFAADSLRNFLWVCFTRSDPACDIYGVGAKIHCKHWGCSGPLVIDARAKPHHAPVLEEDPDVIKRVDRLGIKGGPLHKII
ncbi:MAG TPA: UbiD family decarboxylase [Desulfonatronum sp.]|nr:UbiD family decarboxylase [Desulfonatronum sp.]